MQRILYVLVGVLVIAAAAVTAYFSMRPPPSEQLPEVAPAAEASAPLAPASQ